MRQASPLRFIAPVAYIFSEKPDRVNVSRDSSRGSELRALNTLPRDFIAGILAPSVYFSREDLARSRD